MIRFDVPLKNETQNPSRSISSSAGWRAQTSVSFLLFQTEVCLRKQALSPQIPPCFRLCDHICIHFRVYVCVYFSVFRLHLLSKQTNTKQTSVYFVYYRPRFVLEVTYSFFVSPGLTQIASPFCSIHTASALGL